jgi:hypothetical protein
MLASSHQVCLFINNEERNAEAFAMAATQIDLSGTSALTFLEALALDVALVLKRLGGSAHQNVVIDCVAAMKRSRGEPVSNDLRQAVVEAFESYSDWFARPFGEGSMRWALIADPV